MTIGATFAAFFTVGMTRVAARLMPAGKVAKRSAFSAMSTALLKVSACSTAGLSELLVSCEGAFASS